MLVSSEEFISSLGACSGHKVRGPPPICLSVCLSVRLLQTPCSLHSAASPMFMASSSLLICPIPRLKDLNSKNEKQELHYLSATLQ